MYKVDNHLKNIQNETSGLKLLKKKNDINNG